MAKKLVLGLAPATFPLAVTIPGPVEDAELVLEAKHLRSTDWAKLRDQHQNDVQASVQKLFDGARKDAEAAYEKQLKAKPKAGAKASVDPEQVTEEQKEAAVLALLKPPSDEAVASLRAKHAAEFIGKIASGWQLEDKFDAASLLHLTDLFPAAPQAILDAYGAALEGRRLGN